MSKADAQVIKMLLWLVLSEVITNPYGKLISGILSVYYAFLAIIAV